MSHVEAVRSFNRFYTGRIGVLPEDYLGSSYTLAEARVVYEIGRRRQATATELGRELDLDLGYLSRLLLGLKRRGVIQAKASPEDARRSVLTLTPKGQKSYLALDSRSRKEIGDLLSGLPDAQQARLVNAMSTVESLLGGARKNSSKKPEVRLRAHRPGDMGWVVHRHGALYFEEYGWDERFEALVAGIVARFVESYDARRERCWIAEIDGEPVGSVFVVKENETIAKLRLLLVEPQARGQGLGRRLVEECIRFAREKGYKKLVLWTQANLTAARNIYKTTGFKRVKQEAHRTFGPRVIGEYWELNLSP